MKRQVKIALRAGSNGGLFEFKFRATNKDGGSVVKVLSKKSKQLILENELMAGDEIFMPKISKMNPEYVVSWEDNPAYKSQENDTYKELAQLLKTHHTVCPVKRIKADGTPEYDVNPNMTVHLYDYIDETETADQEGINLHHFYNVANRVRGMNTQQQIDLMYHLGFGSVYQTFTQERKASLTQAYLINPLQGLAVSRNQYDTKTVNGQQIPRSYLEYMTEVYKEDDNDIKLRTLILKALIIQKPDKRTIIERKPDGSFVINENQVLGGSLNDIEFHLKKTPKDQDYIQRMVDTHDVIVEDDIPALLLRKGIQMINGAAKEQTKEEVKGNAYFQEQSNLLNICREKYRMKVGEDEPIEALNKRIAEGQKTWARLNFLPEALKEVKAHPEWTFEKVIEVKAAEAHLLASKGKQGRPAKFVVQT